MAEGEKKKKRQRNKGAGKRETIGETSVSLCRISSSTTRPDAGARRLDKRGCKHASFLIHRSFFSLLLLLLHRHLMTVAARVTLHIGELASVAPLDLYPRRLSSGSNQQLPNRSRSRRVYLSCAHVCVCTCVSLKYT